jgi:glycosyltransferase involved in cell wall biosynthesis
MNAHVVVARDDRHGEGNRVRLGIVDFHPIQYHTPLYQVIVGRARVELNVLFLSDHAPMVDPGFGVPVKWDIDLFSGYEHQFLAPGEYSSIRSRMAHLSRWIRVQDAVVIHGYSHPWMLIAALLCRVQRVPYLLRGDSVPQGQSTGLRRYLRGAVARMVVSASAAGLAIGQLNEEFYRHYGAPRIVWAPYSVDGQRFATPPTTSRPELLRQWSLDTHKPVILFCGKLSSHKRPLDLCEAVKALGHDVNVIFVGDGRLAEKVRSSIVPGAGVVTGFVNQSELPTYYHAADIVVLPSEMENWGLVLNEAMAAGVLPVASDRVGAAPDLVAGMGEVYPCGDVAALATALSRALARASDPRTRDRVKQHAAEFSLDRTAIGYESAAFAVQRPISERQSYGNERSSGTLASIFLVPRRTAETLAGELFHSGAVLAARLSRRWGLC